MFDSLQPQELFSPWNSPGQNTGVGSLSLFQGVFPTQGLNPGLPHCRWILYQLSHQGSPRILEWVAYPFSSRSSRLRYRTWVSCIAGGFFTIWATREDWECVYILLFSFYGWGNWGTKRWWLTYGHTDPGLSVLLTVFSTFWQFCQKNIT